MDRERTPDNFIVLGHIARAHGVHGAVVVIPYSKEPQSILAAERLELLSPDGLKRVAVSSLKGKEAAQGLILKLTGVSSREAAMSLKGWRLGLERRYLPEVSDDEVYLADLMGLEVFTAQDIFIGRVANLIEAGSGIVLAVRKDGETGEEVLLPFHEELLISLNLESGRMVLDLPDGLLEL